MQPLLKAHFECKFHTSVRHRSVNYHHLFRLFNRLFGDRDSIAHAQELWLWVWLPQLLDSQVLDEALTPLYLGHFVILLESRHHLHQFVDFCEVNNEAVIIIVIVLNADPTYHMAVAVAVEVLLAVSVSAAPQIFKWLLIRKVDLFQIHVTHNHLVEDVEIHRQC